MLKTIFNFFKKPTPAPKAPTPYKVESPTTEQKVDKKPVAKKAVDKKPSVKATRKPKAKKTV